MQRNQYAYARCHRRLHHGLRVKRSFVVNPWIAALNPARPGGCLTNGEGGCLRTVNTSSSLFSSMRFWAASTADVVVRPICTEFGGVPGPMMRALSKM